MNNTILLCRTVVNEVWGGMWAESVRLQNTEALHERRRNRGKPLTLHNNPRVPDHADHVNHAESSGFNSFLHFMVKDYILWRGWRPST